MQALKCFSCDGDFSIDSSLKITVKGKDFHIDCYTDNAVIYNNQYYKTIYPDCTQALTGYCELSTSCQKIVNSKLFPNLKPVCIQYQLKMEKDEISDLTYDELLFKCQERNIKIFENNAELAINEGICMKRLDDFLNSDQSKMKQKYLIHGFHNEFTRKLKLPQMPVYLIDISRKYLPVFVF